MMKEKLELKKSTDRKKIVELLTQGKIGLFPTDTVWGICCRMDDANSVEKIFEIKNREKNKPFLVLASDIATVKKIAKFDSKTEEIMKKYWPGPLTIVLNSIKDKVLPIVSAHKKTIAVRIPDNKNLVEIISKLGTPLVAPSANISGKEPALKLDDVNEEIIIRVDFIVLGECKMKKPSTIIDCSVSNFSVVRVGALKIDL